MQWRIPKNSDKYQWTLHVTEKMRYYGLSEQKVLGVIRRPQRIETGIAENTVAVMAPVGNARKANVNSKWRRTFISADAEASDDKWNQEIWVMYQLKSESRKPARNASRIEAGGSKVESLNKDQNSKIQKSQIADEKALKLKKLRDTINNKKKLVIISAWRYPGVSPKNNPIPADILREIEELGLK